MIIDAQWIAIFPWCRTRHQGSYVRMELDWAYTTQPSLLVTWGTGLHGHQVTGVTRRTRYYLPQRRDLPLWFRSLDHEQYLAQV